LGGQELRISLQKLGCETWEEATSKIQEWKLGKTRTKFSDSSATVENAIEAFLTNLRTRNLAASTIRGYSSFMRGVQRFADRKGIRVLSQFDLRLAEEFQASWACKPSSAGLKLIYLSMFLKYALKHKWVAESVAKELDRPMAKDNPRQPYSQDEVALILDALEQYVLIARGTHKQEHARRLRSLCLIMRYSGLRISDAIKLSSDDVHADGKIFLYMTKTGKPVFGVLPEFVLVDLNSCPRVSRDRFFWDGRGAPEFAIQGFRKTLVTVAGRVVRDVGAHRFRDTFAIELLLSGVPLERVSMLLGHKSVVTTQRHYASWIQARQTQLEEDLRMALSKDPLAIREQEKQSNRKLMRVK
jgi:site-specific recombinase XerD